MKALRTSGLAALFALMFVWPIPHTIALRNLLLFLSLLIFAWSAYLERPATEWVRPVRLPVTLYLVLTVWLVLEALLVSNETAWSLSEIGGQWFKGASALAIGGLAALAVREKGIITHRSLMLVVFGALFAHVAYVVGADIAGWFGTGALARRVQGLTEGPDKMNYLTNMLLAILTAEAFFRRAFRRRLLPLPGWLLLAAIGLTGFSSYVEGMRNGMVAALFLFASTGSLYWFERRKKAKRGILLAGLAVFTLACGAFGYLGYKADPRWQTLGESVDLALDTQQHKAWLDMRKYPLPKLASGQEVEPSAYLRAAWMKEGVILALEHPLGLGFGRNAFGHGIKEKYGEGGGHSHSGLLDMAIGAGIPGAFLWAAFLLSLIYLAASTYFRRKNPYAMILFFLVTGYFSRMLVDSVVRDHMLEQFMFLVGLFALLMLKEGRDAPDRQP